MIRPSEKFILWCFVYRKKEILSCDIHWIAFHARVFWEPEDTEAILRKMVQKGILKVRRVKNRDGALEFYYAVYVRTRLGIKLSRNIPEDPLEISKR